MIKKPINTESPSSPETAADDHLEAEIHAHMISLLFKQQPSSMVANFLVSVVFLFLFWDEIPNAILLTWFGVHQLIIALRIYSGHLYKNRDTSLGNDRVWGRASAAITLLVGASWGVSALLFITPENPNSYIILTIIITGFAAGSVTAFAPYFPSFIAQVFPSMGGLMAALLISDDAALTGVAALVGVALFAYTPMSRNVNRTLRRSVSLGLENLALRNRAENHSQLLTTVLESMNQGILVEDSNPKPTLWNDRLLQMLERQAPSSGEQGIQEFLDDIRSKNETPEQSRFEYTPDHGDTVLEIASRNMPNGGLVTTFSDITPLIERERAEERARITAEQANAAKSRFLAAASHDLRQPINALGLFVDTLSECRSPDKSRELIGHVRQSLSTIDTMLNSLLDISKLDAGVVHPRLSSFDLGDLLTEIHRGMAHQAEAADLKLRLHLPQRHAMIRSDRGMLDRVIRNLLTNAIRYTESGGILLAMRRHSGSLRIDVFDTGIGIPDDEREQIFLEFHQVGNQQRDRQQGLGLGLAIVSRLVSLLKLELSWNSEFGKGSRFSIHAPEVVGSTAATPAANPRLPDESIDGLRVLVVDDDPDVLLAMRLLLEQWHCDVRDVSGFETAMDAIKSDWQPAMLIADYRLPGDKDGVEVIQHLQEKLGPVPAMIITGDTGPEHLRRAETSGLPLLHKPVRSARLRMVIGELLSEDTSRAKTAT